MAEDDGPRLEIRDGSAAMLEDLLAGRCTCGSHPLGPHEEPHGDMSAPQSQAGRLFADWLDRNPPPRS